MPAGGPARPQWDNARSVASLDPARWQRVRNLFDAVADLDPAARQARLAELCAGDDELLREVESLIAHDGSTDDAIGRVVEQAALAAVDATSVTGPGQTLLHYRITGPIGEGGMGIVWRAIDETLGRDVAIKVLPPGVGDDPRRLARFEREAKVLASLNHSNIAAIFSLHVQDGVRFLAMEFVPGEDLSTRILRGPLPLDEALRIARQIADALEEAHEQGVVHRDLKPANVKLTPSGKVKVLDFGLAKAFSDSPLADPGTSTSSDSALAQLTTREGVVLGTAAYMPPEQARGLSVDKRADIWAFGAVLFEMLTGARPFAGAAVVDVLAAVVTAEPDWTRLPPGTPLAVERLLRRCLQKDVRQRLRDIGDARIELDHLLSASGDTGTPVPRPDARISERMTPTSRSRRRDAALVAAGTLAAAALVAGVLAWTGWGRSAAPPVRIERLNVALPEGTRLDDVLDYSRHTLALSRDGRRLAFVARDAAGRRRIFVRALDSVEAVPVAGAEDGDMPFFSPDGASLGFASEGKLKRIGLGGGQPTTICDAPEPRGASWSDDGTIVFAPGVFSGLQRVAATGGAPEALTTLDPGSEGSHRWPVVLPGGRHILFSVHPSGSREQDRHIDLLDLASGTRRTLTRGVYPRYMNGYLLYGESGRLLAAPLDTSALALAGPATPVVDDVRMDVGATGLAFLEASASGALVYVPGAMTQAERTIVWLDRTGRATPAARDRRPYLGVRLSPDNRSAAAIVQGTPNSLWHLDLARDAWTRLTSDEGAATPAWLPDGARIVFPNTQLVLFEVPAGGGGTPRRLLPQDGPTGDMPAVSPDGRVLLVGVQDTRGDDILAVALDGRRPAAPFVAGAASETSPAISPGGRWVAYTSNESGRREIYLRAFAGSGRTWPVSIDGGASPRWRGDERELFYLQGAQLMAVPVRLDGDTPSIGTARALFSDAAFSWSGADLFRWDVAVDGQRFIAVQPDPREERALQLVVVPGFAAELRSRLGR